MVLREVEGWLEDTMALEYEGRETDFYRDGFVSESEFVDGTVLEFGEKSVDLIFAENMPGIVFLGNDAAKEKVFRNAAVNKTGITFSVCNTHEDDVVCDKLA